MILKKILSYKNQELIVSTPPVYSIDQVNDLGYEDFIIELAVKGQIIADISKLLEQEETSFFLIDSVDWCEMYADAVTEKYK